MTIEGVQRLHLAERRRSHPALDQPLAAHEQFVLEDQLQEFVVAEIVAGRFLETDLQRLGQARQTKLLERGQ